MASPALFPLVEEWLAYVDRGRTRDDKGNTLDARVRDIGRWGRLLRLVLGWEVPDEWALAPLPPDSPPDPLTGRVDLAAELSGLTISHLTEENVVAAFDYAKNLKGVKANGKHYSERSLARWASTMRGFAEWAVTRGYLNRNPLADLRVQVPAVPTVRAFTAQEVEAMLHAAANPPENLPTRWAERDVALVSLLAGCGTRASETIGLEVRDAALTADPPMLHLLRGVKRQKPRDIPIRRHTVDALERWLGVRAEWANQDPIYKVKPTAPMFVRRDLRKKPGTMDAARLPLDRNALDHLLRSIADQAGVTPPGDALAHAFRHHFGAELARRGVPPFQIQQLMGHTDPRTTSIYTQLAGLELHAALAEAGWD